MMREVACGNCGCTDRRVVYAGTLPPGPELRFPLDPYSARYQINRCSRCGLLYASPILEEKLVGRLYTEVSGVNVAAGEEHNVRRTMELYYQTVRRHIRQKRRYLDIGCDVGLLLEAARRDGFGEIHGIEPVPAAAAVARQVAGARISTRFYEEEPYPDDHFDLITLIHVLDHLVELDSVLSRVQRQLAPGGIVFAVVHDSGSLLARVTGSRFPPFNLYHHFYFSKETLADLFRRRSFSVLDTAATMNCYSLSFLARRAPVVPAALRPAVASAARRLGLDGVDVTLPLGNIGVVARRDPDADSTKPGR
jgi:SAM-dependent methyltransferase